MQKTNFKTQEEYTRDILDTIRECNCGTYVSPELLKEEKEDNNIEDEKSIPITDDIRFGQNVLSNQINEFRDSVESGAQFSKPNMNKVSESPLIFMPKEGNVVFSGIIPCLNNMKWQFKLKTNTGSGCFIWADGLILNKDNIKILQKLFGFYENWKNEWNASSSDLEQLSNIFNEED